MNILEKKRVLDLLHRADVFMGNLRQFVGSADWTVAETAARSAVENLQELIDRIVKHKSSDSREAK